jgi:hypothetical protein
LGNCSEKLSARSSQRGNSVATVEENIRSTPQDKGGASTVISRHDLQELSRIPSLSGKPWKALAWILQAGLGLVFLVALLALCASIPVLNLLALGYLMEVQARVARSGKLRSAFYLIPAAQRLGCMLLATWLWLLPIDFMAGAARDSWLLAPGTSTAWLWTLSLVVVSLLIAVHLLVAIACGGGWWRFVRPISNARWLVSRLRLGQYWQGAHDAIREFVAAFECTRLLRLGLLGFAAAYVWLVFPTLLFTMLDDVTNRWQIAGFLVGCVALTVTLTWLPLLMVHVAVEGRWRAMFALTAVRRLALQSPFCWAIATAILLACSTVPMLYTALLKNQIPPHDARWDVMLVFLVTVVPARALLGWVYHRATRQPQSTPTWLWRIWQATNVAALCAGAGFYVYFLNLAATGGELGQRAVWQLHAVLLPFPF